MKRLNYSSITAAIRRIHAAKAKSDSTGIPIGELLEQDRELRKKLLREREENKQRREFLKAAGGLGLGAGLLSANSLAFANNGNGNGGNQPSIAIVGAGAGGLRTAHRLMQYGISSRVYEANNRVGGRMYSDRSAESGHFGDDRAVEWGGEFISTEHNAIRNLAHQLNLQLEDVNKLSLGDEETYLIEGELHTEADLMDEWVGGLYDTMKRAQMEAWWQPTYNNHVQAHVDYDNMRAIEYMSSIGYPESHWVHKLLMADLVAEYGLTETNSALNLIYLLAWNTHNSGGLPLAGTDERLHVVGGNDKIMTGMRDQLPPGTVELEKKLEAITSPPSKPQGPYTLHFVDGSNTTCDVLVLALPINLIGTVQIDPHIVNALNPKKVEAFNRTSLENVSDNGKIMMEFDARFWDQTRNINGQQVHMAARAYSFSGTESSGYSGYISTWEGEPGNPSTLGVMINYNGGYEARNLTSTNLHGVADFADVQRFFNQANQLWHVPGGVETLYTGNALVSNWIDDPFARSAFTSPAFGTMTSWWGAQWESDPQAFPAEANIYFAGEAYDEEYWSYMNGAILSGERVAREIHQNY